VPRKTGAPPRTSGSFTITSPARFTLRALGPIALNTSLLSTGPRCGSPVEQTFFVHKFFPQPFQPLMRKSDWPRATLVAGRGPFGRMSGEGSRAVDSLGVASQLGSFRHSCFRPLGAPAPDPCSLTIWLCSAADARSGRCPKRVSAPLIHWELRPNWVRFVGLGISQSGLVVGARHASPAVRATRRLR